MAFDLNRATILGRLGSEPKLNHTASGKSVCNLSVATNREWVDEAGAEQKRTTWHRVVVWGKLAEWCCKALPVGARLYVEGPMEPREWTDKKDGQHHTTEIRALSIIWSNQPSSGDRQAPPPTDADAPPPGDDDIPF